MNKPKGKFECESYGSVGLCNICDAKITLGNRRLEFYNRCHSRIEYVCKKHVYDIKFILDERGIGGVYILIGRINKAIQKKIMNPVRLNSVGWDRGQRTKDWHKIKRHNGEITQFGKVFSSKLIIDDQREKDEMTFLFDKIDIGLEIELVQAVMKNIIYWDTSGELDEEIEAKI